MLVPSTETTDFKHTTMVLPSHEQQVIYKRDGQSFLLEKNMAVFSHSVCIRQSYIAGADLPFLLLVFFTLFPLLQVNKAGEKRWRYYDLTFPGKLTLS